MMCEHCGRDHEPRRDAETTKTDPAHPAAKWRPGTAAPTVLHEVATGDAPPRPAA